jgi:hypothetical protein
MEEILAMWLDKMSGPQPTLTREAVDALVVDGVVAWKDGRLITRSEMFLSSEDDPAC